MSTRGQKDTRKTIFDAKNRTNQIITQKKNWSKLILEDLKVLKRSPDLLNNVKIGQGQLQLIMEQILFYHI